MQTLVWQAQGGTGVVCFLPALKQRGAVRALGLSLPLKQQVLEGRAASPITWKRTVAESPRVAGALPGSPTAV